MRRFREMWFKVEFILWSVSVEGKSVVSQWNGHLIFEAKFWEKSRNSRIEMEANCFGSTDCMSTEIFAILNAYLINAWNNFYAIAMWHVVHRVYQLNGLAWMDATKQHFAQTRKIDIICCAWMWSKLNWTHNCMHTLLFSRK